MEVADRENYKQRQLIHSTHTYSGLICVVIKKL